MSAGTLRGAFRIGIQRHNGDVMMAILVCVCMAKSVTKMGTLESGITGKGLEWM